MTQQAHLLPDRLPRFGKATTAHWSLRPGGKAIVFVHGFSGGAIDTWTNFPAMLTTDARFSQVDLLFYGYDGLQTQAGTSAALFLDFLGTLAQTPADLYGNVRPVG